MAETCRLAGDTEECEKWTRHAVRAYKAVTWWDPRARQEAKVKALKAKLAAEEKALAAAVKAAEEKPETASQK
jgi:hypothetical protein